MARPVGIEQELGIAIIRRRFANSMGGADGQRDLRTEPIVIESSVMAEIRTVPTEFISTDLMPQLALMRQSVDQVAKAFGARSLAVGVLPSGTDFTANDYAMFWRAGLHINIDPIKSVLAMSATASGFLTPTEHADGLRTFLEQYGPHLEANGDLALVSSRLTWLAKNGLEADVVRNAWRNGKSEGDIMQHIANTTARGQRADLTIAPSSLYAY